MNRLAIAASAVLFLASAFALGYARGQLQHAWQVRWAACQMLPDRKSWEDFECERVLKEMQP